MCIKRPILLAPTFATLLCPDSIHSPDIRQPFSPDSIHSPDIRQPFPRTRYIHSHWTFAIFEKNVSRLDTFARVICHFGEFGASGHCLSYFQTSIKGLPVRWYSVNLKTSTVLKVNQFNIWIINLQYLFKWLIWFHLSSTNRWRQLVIINSRKIWMKLSCTSEARLTIKFSQIFVVTLCLALTVLDKN